MGKLFFGTQTGTTAVVAAEIQRAMPTWPKIDSGAD